MNENMLTHMRPLPSRKPVKWGGKVRWVPTSVRFSPELHTFLKEYSKAQNVDMGYVITELCEQLKHFETAKKRGQPK